MVFDAAPAHHRLAGPNVFYRVTCFRRSVGLLYTLKNRNVIISAFVTRTSAHMAQSEARKKEIYGVAVAACRAENI